MELFAIETGYFKLDGGAMFGAVPKTIWNRNYPADENNLNRWAMRSMLIKMDNRLILIDTGIGDKQSEKFFSFLYLHGEDSLQKSIEKLGFTSDDITDVILTHLHFDHVGGAVKRDVNGNFISTFKNATYWSTKSHWEWAVNPNPREKASFLSENIFPIQQAEQLQFIEDKDLGIKGLELLVVNGHTEGQIIPVMDYKNQKVAFMADLVPSLGHLNLAYIPSYDTRPLISMQEKEDFYNKALHENIALFFQHDPQIECCTIQSHENKVKAKQVFKLNEL
jgi:glyoxylase-like metal-dependent hydrolase (beta-lactamase superfamily II)